MDGRTATLGGVSFPYRAEDLYSVLDHPKEKGCSVCYSMEIHKKEGRAYLIVKATFTLRNGRVNAYAGDGVIAVDLNLDNIAWAEINKDGCRIGGGEVRFNLEGKTSNQVSDILGRACQKVASICQEKKKPLAMEDLNLSKKKAGLSYGNKKANRGTSIFAYKKMGELLHSAAFRRGIGVIKVNPVYTSLIGKLKYMRKMRTPVHQSAAVVIGRRAMGFREKIPTYLKKVLPENKKRSHHWKQFAHFLPLVKMIRTRVFLKRLPEFPDGRSMKALCGSG